MASAQFIATGSDDGTAKIWSYDEKRQDKPGVMRMATLKSHIAGITSISWSPPKPGEEKNARILTTSKDWTLKVWRPFDSTIAKTGVVPHDTLPKHTLQGRVSGGGVSDGGKKDEDQRHTDYVNMAAWKHGGRDAGQKIVSCSDDKSAAIWNVNEGSREFKLRAEGTGHTGEVSMVTWGPDCQRILTCSYDMYCILWSPRNGHFTKQFPTSLKNEPNHCHQAPIWTARFSPEGHDFLTASQDGTARIWDITTGACQILHDQKIPSESSQKFTHTECVFDAQWNKHDPNQIVTCSLDMTAKIWDKRTGQVAQPLTHHSAAVWCAAFGNDPAAQGRMVLTCSHDMTALVYDQRLGMPKNMLAGHRGILWQAIFSPDDDYILTCSEDRTARLWNLSTGARRPPCHILSDNGGDSHMQAVTCAAFMDREEPK